MLSSTMLIGAVLLLFATAFWIMQPLPEEKKVANQRLRTERDIGKQIDAAESNNATLQADIDPMLWDGTAEQVGPRALSTVTKLAQTRHLKIIAFRPQKPVDAEGLVQIPFSISVEGAYPDTMRLVKDLETSNSKLAVSLVQVQASDAATDHVTGTVNVVAYMKPAPAPAATTKGGSGAQKS